jgi:tRNA pseudouridine38-40 synthase
MGQAALSEEAGGVGSSGSSGSSGSESRCLKLTLEYDGTAYHGWQAQPALPTIQGRLEEALGRLIGAPVSVMGAGRTDAGVHALGQVASFRAVVRLEPPRLRRALNACLPPDICVRAVEEETPDFDARRSARGKLYRYTLLRRETPSAFQARVSLHVPYPLDLAAMQEGATALLGTHDFTSFRAGSCGAPSPVRTVREAAWRVDGEWWHFEIRGNGFLQHMVRIIVGTLLEVGRGRRTVASVAEALGACDRRRAGQTAPPHGLFLVAVDY